MTLANSARTEGASEAAVIVAMTGKDNSQLWVEKYRPRGISDVTHQDEVVSTLQKAVKESAGCGDLPHLLFYGPPGTGKTSTALALVRDLFGPQNARARVLELNASDERGIKVVRDKIKTFAQTTVSAVANPKPGDTKTYPCPPFKVIILDEADAITIDAQTALRRTMETHSKMTRFILICNYISRIIGPLTSRCAKFRFSPVPLQAMTGLLRRIATAEGVNIADETLRSLIETSEGDLRKAINTLQSAHRMQPKSGTLDMEVISAAACLIPVSVLDVFDEKTSIVGSTNVEVRRVVEEIIMEGYSASQLLSQYGDRLLGGSESKGIGQMNDLQKSSIAIILAIAEKALIDGCDEQLQLYDVASKISRIAALKDDVEGLFKVQLQ